MRPINAEEWKPVVGYEERYEVSNWGNVRSVDQVIVDRLNRRRIQRGRNKRYMLCGFGYHRYELNRFGERKSHAAHRLVALAFLPPPKPGQIVVRHLDNNPDNNHWSNLAWGTQQENVADTIKAGRYVNGNTHKENCPKGHEYSGRNGRGDRVCHQCRRDQQRQYLARKSLAS